MFGALVSIDVKSSIILDAPLSDCWSVCKAWGRQPWLPLLPDGTTFDVRVLDNFSENQIGAIRRDHFGGGPVLFERLVAVDEEEHVMKWQAISHEGTVSPFEEASFVNFNTSLTLHSVTMGNATFAEWKGKFYTEPAFATSMRETFEQWYVFGMLSLKEYMARYKMKQKRLTGPTISRNPSRQMSQSVEHGPNSRQGEHLGYGGLNMQ